MTQMDDTTLPSYSSAPNRALLKQTPASAQPDPAEAQVLRNLGPDAALSHGQGVSSQILTAVIDHNRGQKTDGAPPAGMIVESDVGGPLDSVKYLQSGACALVVGIERRPDGTVDTGVVATKLNDQTSQYEPLNFKDGRPVAVDHVDLAIAEKTAIPLEEKDTVSVGIRAVPCPRLGP
jgi:hypothetical protein